MNLINVFRRAFSSNLQTVSTTEGERAVLSASGIHQPIMQSYFAWRRSLVMFVVLATILNAGLSTFRDATETDERPDIYETISKHFSFNAAPIVPAALNAQELIESNRSEEEEEETEEEPTPANETEADAAEAEDSEEPQTAFAHFSDFVHLMALYALPVASLAVVFLWTRFRLSFQIMVVAFTFSFMVPLVIALCPWSWWGYVEPKIDPKTQPVEYYKLVAEGMLEGVSYLVTLLPTVLSLVPGVQRACVRVKTLLPQSMLPGWFLVSASPFYALFLLVVFVSANQVVSDPLFFVGMLLFLSAPLMFAIRADVITAPLATESDFKRLRGVQRIIGMMTVAAGLLLVICVTRHEFMGIRLFGLDAKTALLLPLDLVEFFLEVMGRSMFMTVLGADLFMRMNLGAWKSMRDFANTPEAEHYNNVMGEFEQIVK